ncbi:MAG: ACT domain-containing protein [Pseudomonadota bacterium]
MTGLTLELLPGRLAVCRLAAGAPWPAWADGPGLVSLTRSERELSVVCAQERVPAGVPGRRGWRALRVAGVLDLGLVGVMAGLTAPLAAAGISVFSLATHDTDYLLVAEDDLAPALKALAAAGHRPPPAPAGAVD